MILGFPFLAIVPSLAAMAGPWIAFRIWKTEPSDAYNRYLALAGMVLIFFAISFCLALWLTSVVSADLMKGGWRG
jgi:hypothetical protein